MAQKGVPIWSQTAATNASVDGDINFAEGQAPSSVNDSARAVMAAIAKWRDDNSGLLVTSGTSTAYSVTTNTGFYALIAGLTVAFQVNVDCGATVTLAPDGLTAKPLRSAAGVELVAGALKAGSTHRAAYFTSNSGEWIIQDVNPTIIAAGQVITASLADAAVTYAKIQNVADQRFLGNFSGGAAAPSEYSGVGPTVSGSVITFPAPLPGGFANLSIKVASNTTVACAADFFTLTDGTSFKTFSAPSGTINLGTNGAANALDTSTIAIDTWYAIWGIGKTDGTCAWLASASGTSPTMPTGYTFKKRFGWVRTIHASATLYGTWQLGRRAQYVLGLAQTSTLPLLFNGAVGSGTISSPTYASTSVSSLVPSSASSLRMHSTNSYLNIGTSGNTLLAPSTGYGGYLSSTSPPFIHNTNGSTTSYQIEILLESTNVATWSSGASCAVWVLGWEDNI